MFEFEWDEEKDAPSAASASESSRADVPPDGRSDAMKKSYDFAKAKRAKKRALPPIEDLDRHTKVRITIYVDGDVLEHFKRRAEEPGALPYQTQINQALREAMVRAQSGGRSLQDDDDRLIDRLADRVAERLKRPYRPAPAQRKRRAKKR
jgi:uncharacterized protein (DUF4415 family)